jgi:formiminotetrahydrofolate cyclodeaminase
LKHSEEESIFDVSLGEFLRRLGSSDPTPGGGAAAALVGALGAALVEMTANLTMGRPRFADVEEQARRIEGRSADLRQRLQRLADADAEAFKQVGAAYRLPRADEAQKAVRAEAIQTALQEAAQVPLETAQLAREVIELSQQAAPILNPSVISDVLVGALLAQAALQGAALNVEINLAAMTDTTSIERYSAELQQARSEVDERVARVLEIGRSRFPGH